MQEADTSGYITNGEWDLMGKPGKDAGQAARGAHSRLRSR